MASSSSSSSSSSTASRLGLCQASSFCAENVMLTVVPEFNFRGKVPLLSSPHMADGAGGSTTTSSIGPMVSGLPIEVPLWVAKTLHQRRLAQVQLPDWLTSTSLLEILQEERESALLSTALPYYYYEVARALHWLLDPAGAVLLQDLTSLRLDKIRQNFHELSRSDLQDPPQDDNDEDNEDDNEKNGHDDDGLPTIAITGIASYEINKVGPFLRRAFSDYGYLTQKTMKDDEGMMAGPGKGSNDGSRKNRDADDGDDDDDDKSNRDGRGESQGASQDSRKVLGRSRLRRFRQ